MSPGSFKSSEKQFGRAADEIAGKLPAILHVPAGQMNEQQLSALLKGNFGETMPGARGVSVGQVLKPNIELDERNLRRLGAAVVARVDSPEALNAFRGFFLNPQKTLRLDEPTLNAYAFELAGMGEKAGPLLYDMLSTPIKMSEDEGRRVAVSAFTGLNRMCLDNDKTVAANAINMVGYTLFNNPDDEIKLRAVGLLDKVYKQNQEPLFIERAPAVAPIRDELVSFWVNEYESIWKTGKADRLADYMVLEPPKIGKKKPSQPLVGKADRAKIEMPPNVKKGLDDLRVYMQGIRGGE